MTTQAQLDQIRQQTGLVLTKDYVPLRYQDAETSNQAALDWIKDPSGILYLYGPTGTGKTHTAWAITKHYLYNDPSIGGHGPFEGGSLSTLLEAMKPGRIPDDDRGTLLDPRERAARTRLLFLDDLGASQVTDWALDTLFYILDTRYNEMRATIISSNLKPGDDLTELVGERIVSRIAQDHTLIRMTGDDRRLLTAH